MSAMFKRGLSTAQKMSVSLRCHSPSSPFPLSVRARLGAHPTCPAEMATLTVARYPLPSLAHLDSLVALLCSTLAVVAALALLVTGCVIGLALPTRALLRLAQNVYFDVTKNDAPFGRIVFKLYDDVSPRGVAGNSPGESCALPP